MENIEKSLVLIKPDGVERRLVGEIISRFEKVGLEIIALKMVKVGKKIASKHYGYDNVWFENVGKKVREFYKKVGFDPGEKINKLSNKEIGKLVQKWNVDYLSEGKTLALILKGPHAVEVVRKIVGSTFPFESLPGTIRGDFATDSPLVANTNQRAVRNLIHASSSAKEARIEIELWFKKNEIFG